MTTPRVKRERVQLHPVHGIVLLDKSTGVSSNGALQRIRFLLRAEKGGHTGALDPLASGMLPLCFGEASKIAGYLLGSDKAYETVARLGTVTDTDDAEGQVIRTRDVRAFDMDTLRRYCDTLTGTIQQQAPIYSALKQGGEPLYAKARRGEAVEAPIRSVHVRNIEILECTADRIRLRIECGSGTYIRSIVRDLGEMLGCGAHVEQLRRLWVHPFVEQDMRTAEEIEQLIEQGRLDEVLLPIETGLRNWQQLPLTGEQIRTLSHGKVQPVAAQDGEFLAMSEQGTALGLVSVDQGLLRAKRLFSWIGDPALHSA